MEEFVSRREKQKQKREEKAPPKKPSSQSWYKKRPVIITAAVVAAVLVVALIVVLVLQSAANSTYDKMQSTKANTAQQLESLQKDYNNASPQDRLSKFRHFAESIEVVPCDQAGTLPWLSGQRQQCEGFAEASKALQSKATAAADLLEYDIYVKEKLAPAIQTEKEIADYAAEAGKWQSLAQELNNAPQKNKVEDVHGNIVKAAEAIVVGWRDVAKASEEENAENFKKARDALPGKYEALQNESDKLTNVYTQAQQELEAAYNTYDEQL